MKRINGRLPWAEVAIEKTFTSESNKDIKVEAGDKGWTIIWPDHSTEYEDIERPANENLIAAIEVLDRECASLEEKIIDFEFTCSIYREIFASDDNASKVELLDVLTKAMNKKLIQTVSEKDIVASKKILDILSMVYDLKKTYE